MATAIRCQEIYVACRLDCEAHLRVFTGCAHSCQTSTSWFCRISCVGIYVASMVTGKGPYSLLLEHVQDPLKHNAVQNLL